MDAWAFGLGLLVLFSIGIFVINLTKFHKCKYGEIQKDGFQYCDTCNLAAVPLERSCQHKWKVKTGPSKVTRGNYWIGNLYVLECKLCGDLKQFKEEL